MKEHTNSKNIFKSILETIINDYIIIFAVILLVIVLSFMTESFMTVTNIMNVLRQMSMVAILAVGMFFVMVGGGIDISVGSLVGLTSIVTAAALTNWNLHPAVAILLSLAVGAFCGLINGTFVAKIGVPALIGTLGMMEVARGLLYVFTEGYPIGIKVHQSVLLVRDIYGKSLAGNFHAGDIFTVAILFHRKLNSEDMYML